MEIAIKASHPPEWHVEKDGTCTITIQAVAADDGDYEVLLPNGVTLGCDWNEQTGHVHTAKKGS